MMRIALTVSLLIFLMACQAEKPPIEKALPDLTRYVDPQIGSVHGRWFFYTPAAHPFGMAKLAPHTNAYNSQGGWGPTGYDDRHTSIEGFGHFHEFQIGGLVFMPTTGKLKTLPGSLEQPDDGYRSRFDKESEQTEAGYYSVFLKDYQVKAELTASPRVGFHRYSFPKTEEAHVIIDIGHKQGESGGVTEAFAQVVNENEVEGYIETYPEYLKFCDPDKRVKMYFVARFSKAPVNTSTFVDSLIQEGRASTNGINNGLGKLNFALGQEPGRDWGTSIPPPSMSDEKLQ